MKHYETVVIQCDDIGARCGDVGARCGDVCVCGSDVGDRAEVIRCDDIGAQCGDIGARCGDVGAATSVIARSYRRYRRGVTGDIGAELLAISARSLWRYRRGVSGDIGVLVAPRLSVVFWQLVRLGSFPACWRQANVTPIPQGPPTSCVANYQPISITSVLSKVFERLVAVRLGQFMERSGVLPTTQFAYRKGLDT